MAKNTIVENLKKQIEKFEINTKAEKVGHVIEVFDGIAKVSGLSDLKASEMVTFASGATGVALNLDEDSVGVIVLGGFYNITGEILSVPVGDAQIGRVLNALGAPIDGKGKVASKQSNPIERVASGVMSRQSVDQPVQTESNPSMQLSLSAVANVSLSSATDKLVRPLSLSMQFSIRKART